MDKVEKYKLSQKRNNVIIKQLKILNNERMMEIFELDEEEINLIFIDYDINISLRILKDIAKRIKDITKYKQNEVLNILSKEMGYKNYHHLSSEINKEVK
jgi:hypothetical protein